MKGYHNQGKDVRVALQPAQARLSPPSTAALSTAQAARRDIIKFQVSAGSSL
jgi:hypothetical protein